MNKEFLNNEIIDKIRVIVYTAYYDNNHTDLNIDLIDYKVISDVELILIFSVEIKKLIIFKIEISSINCVNSIKFDDHMEIDASFSVDNIILSQSKLKQMKKYLWERIQSYQVKLVNLVFQYKVPLIKPIRNKSRYEIINEMGQR